jgi:hypothetical protein
MKNNVRSSYGYNGTVPCGRLCRGGYYWEGFQDIFTWRELEKLGQALITGVGIGEAARQSLRILEPKGVAKAVAIKGAKWIPFVGWGLAAYSVHQTAEEVEGLAENCRKDEPMFLPGTVS